jgi:tryptophanyl-tRNA synthetase
MQEAYKKGIGWGDAKQMLFERIDSEIAPMREKYEYLMRNPAEVEAILLKGASKARALCTPFMQSLRQAVGLRSLGGMNDGAKTDKKAAKAAVASFKQYREADGLFYFKLVDAQALVLLQSRGFASPKEAGQVILRIKTDGVGVLSALSSQLNPTSPEEVRAISDALTQMV